MSRTCWTSITPAGRFSRGRSSLPLFMCGNPGATGRPGWVPCKAMLGGLGWRDGSRFTRQAGSLTRGPPCRSIPPHLGTSIATLARCVISRWAKRANGARRGAVFLRLRCAGKRFGQYARPGRRRRIRIVDRDFVELANLHRQILFDETTSRPDSPRPSPPPRNCDDQFQRPDRAGRRRHRSRQHRAALRGRGRDGRRHRQFRNPFPDERRRGAARTALVYGGSWGPKAKR